MSVKKSLEDTLPKRYANARTLGKRDGVPVGLAVLILGGAWLAHDVLSVPLPSDETLEFGQHLIALLGFPAGVMYARRFRP